MAILQEPLGTWTLSVARRLPNPLQHISWAGKWVTVSSDETCGAAPHGSPLFLPSLYGETKGRRGPSPPQSQRCTLWADTQEPRNAPVPPKSKKRIKAHSS